MRGSVAVSALALAVLAARYNKFYSREKKRSQFLQVSSVPDNINDAVKALVCPKVKLDHMDREVYNPSCLLYCSDLCGVRF